MTDDGVPSGRPSSVRLLAFGAAVVVGAAVVWLLVTGLLARADLNRARDGVGQLRQDLLSGDLGAARRDLKGLQDDVASGHGRTGGPVWWIAAHVPWLGSPLNTTRAIAVDGQLLADQALPQILEAAKSLDPHELRVAPDRIDLARLQAAQPSLARALPIVSRVQARVAATSGSWLGPVSAGRSSLLSQLDSLSADLHDITAAVNLAPAMLGKQAERRYLVVFEGDTEARGTGGIMGGYALLDAKHGRLTFVRYGPDGDFNGAASGIDLGAEFDDLYSGDDPSRIAVNADLSPNFPYAAEIWSGMARQVLGVPVDGVIALDPEVLAKLLAVTGPVTLTDGTQLTTANVVHELDVDVYERFNADTVARKAFFIEAAQAVVHAALSRHLDTEGLLQALTQPVNERRLVVYSAVSSEEGTLAEFPIGGVLPQTSRPFVDVVLNNASATKLDGYLDERVDYHRASCAAGPASVTVTLTNDAPADGLPSYVTDGLSWTAPHTAGTDRLVVGLYGTAGSQQETATVDGKRVYVASGEERGHPVITTLVSILPGQTRTVVFSVEEPVATGPVVELRQPLANEPSVKVNAPSCR